MKHRNKHRWDILQEIFRFVALENGGVLPQLIGDLVDDELTFWLKRIVRLSQQRSFFIDFENAEWNAGENVIARSESSNGDLTGGRRSRRRKTRRSFPAGHFPDWLGHKH